MRRFKQSQLPKSPSEIPLEETNGAIKSLIRGEYRSANYRRGQKGWRIDSEGNAEFQNVNVGRTIISISPGQSIQGAIDELSDGNGGTVFLKNGIYNQDSNIVLTDGVTIEGESSGGAIIDFGGGAFQVQGYGSNPYSTGVVSIVIDSSTVTGTGTIWDSSMEGQFIALQGVFYEIATVNSSASITLSSVFSGTRDIVNGTYVIADPIYDIHLLKLTLQNSTASTGTVHFRYSSVTSLEDCTHLDSTRGFMYQDSDYVTIDGSGVFSCDTGVNITQCGLLTYDNWNIIDTVIGDALTLEKVFNTQISNFTTNNATGIGIVFINSADMGVFDFGCSANGSHGISMTGTEGVLLSIATINDNGGDGIRLVTDSNTNIINSNNIVSNAGYGFNVTTSSCEENILLGNVIKNNTSGSVNDLGTDTLIRSNIGVSDSA